LVLTDKLKNDQLHVVDELSIDSHKTKEVLRLLQELKLEGKILVVDSKENKNLYLGSRNLQAVKMVPAGGVNIYDLLNHENVLISKSALMELQEVLQR